MKKTTFEAIVNAITNTTDARLDVDKNYLEMTDLQIKECQQIHFFFDELKVNERSATCKKACKRFSFNASQVVINKYYTDAFDFSLENITFNNAQLSNSKNYVNINIDTAKIDYSVLLNALRNAYYESIATSLENAIEITFAQTTSVTKKRTRKSKAN